MTSKVVVVDYDATWPQRFAELHAFLWPAVAHIATSIEHVGSTSVPGLAAKPVIDIDVVVPERKVVAAIARLIGLGYEHRGDLGIPGREVMGRPPNLARHHLYVCARGSQALVNHLSVRDYLRTHPSAATEYGELKKRLAQTFAHDIDSYIEGKTEFLVSILRKTGLDEDSLFQIERLNTKPHTGD